MIGPGMMQEQKLLPGVLAADGTLQGKSAGTRQDSSKPVLACVRGVR